jgi:hypothetical protein
MTVAAVVDLGTIGADGLTTYVGVGAANSLKPTLSSPLPMPNPAMTSFGMQGYCLKPTTSARKRFRNSCLIPL